MLIQHGNEHEKVAGGELPKETQWTNTPLKDVMGRKNEKKRKRIVFFFFFF